MLPLKLVRSLVFGEATLNHPTLFSRNHLIPVSDPHNLHLGGDSSCDDNDGTSRRTGRRHEKTHKTRAEKPVLVFLPTRQLITDTYTLANVARAIGMDIRPNPSLSHIIFNASLASSPFPSSSSSSTSTSPLSSIFPPSTSPPFSFSSLNDGVALPFPSLSSASLSQLQSFVALSKGFFKIALLRPNYSPKIRSFACDPTEDQDGNWDCCSISLFSRASNERVDSMDGFCRALAGNGWTFFKTRKEDWVSGCGRGDGACGGNEVYLFRKVDSNRVRVRVGGNSGDECRVRELRLPFLDFGNAPLRILQYVLLMTGDVFYLA